MSVHLTKNSGPLRGVGKALRKLVSKLRIIGVGNSPTSKAKGMETTYYAQFKNAPLIGKVFHAGNHLMRVVSKESNGRSYICQVVPFNSTNR